MWRYFYNRTCTQVGLGLLVAVFIVATIAPFVIPDRPSVWRLDVDNGYETEDIN